MTTTISTGFFENRFTRTLLATTCLGTMSGVSSSGQVIIEGTSPAPSDFGNSFALAYALPTGTTTVRGTDGGSDTDWFEFSNLASGTSFSLRGTYNPLGQEKGSSFTVFNSSQASLGSATLEGLGGSVNGVVPSDGQLFVRKNAALSNNYQMDMTATVVPEPSQTALVAGGLTLAGALVWRRKHPKVQ